MFAREGYPFILGGALIAAIAFAMALRLRSWPLWLVAMVLTLVALWAAWLFRNPTRVGERAATVALAKTEAKIVRITNIDAPAFVTGPTVRVSRVNPFLPLEARLRVTLGQRTVAAQTVIADLPPS